MSEAQYVLHRNLASIKSFDVTDAGGAHAYGVKFHVEGLTKESWTFTDAGGQQVGKLTRAGVHVHPTFALDRPGQGEVTISKANFMPVQETWRVQGTELGDLDVNGNLADHEYAVTSPDSVAVGHASRSWVTIRDTYGITVDGVDPVVVLATALAIDVIEHSK
ncbi:MAG: LURP-one-related/scramblase family protein [Actinomycetota bacterium]